MATGFSTVDVYGHLGGLIAGFFFASYMMVHMRGSEANRPGSYERICKWVGFGGTCFFFVLCFTLFFTVTKNSIRC